MVIYCFPYENWMKDPLYHIKQWGKDIWEKYPMTLFYDSVQPPLTENVFCKSRISERPIWSIGCLSTVCMEIMEIVQGG